MDDLWGWNADDDDNGDDDPFPMEWIFQPRRVEFGKQ